MGAQATFGSDCAIDAKSAPRDTPEIRVFFFELEQVENIVFDAGDRGRPTGFVLAGTARA